MSLRLILPSGNLEGVYSKTAKAISDGTIKCVEDLAKDQAIASLIPQDDRFVGAVRTVTVPTASLARYYLRRLQIAKDGNKEPQYTPSADTGVSDPATSIAVEPFRWLVARASTKSVHVA